MHMYIKHNLKQYDLLEDQFQRKYNAYIMVYDNSMFVNVNNGLIYLIRI